MHPRSGPGRVALGVAALVLLGPLGACGGDDGDEGPGQAGRPSSSAAPPSTAMVGGSTTTSAPSADGDHLPSSTGGAPSDGEPTVPAATAPAGSLAAGGVGDLAAALLRPGHGDRIVLEVRAQTGAEPGAATLDHLRSVLRAASGKTVVVDGVDPLGGGAAAWTAGSIVRAADGAAAFAQGGDQVVLRLLFLRGTYQGDGSVLGVAVRGDVAAVFTERVEAAAGLFSSPAVVEDAVTVHEVGHLLGLVDLVIDTGRADPDHPGHSTNESSVMYWAVESDLVGQVLGGGIPTDFDAQDRADLARIRGG